MKAIEDGIITPTIKSRLEELEALKAELKDKIIIEEYKNKNKLTKEKIIHYLTKSLDKEPQVLFHTLIDEILVYDDKLISTINTLRIRKLPTMVGSFLLTVQQKVRVGTVCLSSTKILHPILNNLSH